jgi:hypothetical protein
MLLLLNAVLKHSVNGVLPLEYKLTIFYMPHETVIKSLETTLGL